MASPSDNPNINEQEQQQLWLAGQSSDYNGGYAAPHYYPGGQEGGHQHRAQPPPHQQLQQMEKVRLPPQQQQQQHHQPRMMMTWAGLPPNPLNDNLAHDSRSGDNNNRRMDIDTMTGMHGQDIIWQPPLPPASDFHAPRALPQPLSQDPKFPSYSFPRQHNQQQQLQQYGNTSSLDAVVVNSSHQQRYSSSSPYTFCFPTASDSAAYPPHHSHDADPGSVAVTTTTTAPIQARRSSNFMPMKYALPCGNIHDAMMTSSSTNNNYSNNSVNINNDVILNAAVQLASSMVTPTNMMGVGYPTQPAADPSPSFGSQYHDTSDNNNIMVALLQMMSQEGSDEQVKCNIMPAPIYYPNQPHHHLPQTTPLLGMMSAMPSSSLSSTSMGSTGPQMSAAETSHYHHHHQQRQQQQQQHLHPMLVYNSERDPQLSGGEYTNNIMSIDDTNSKLNNNDINHCNNNNDNFQLVVAPLPPSATVPALAANTTHQVSLNNRRPLSATTSLSLSSNGKCGGVVLQPPPIFNTMMNAPVNSTFQPLPNNNNNCSNADIQCHKSQNGPIPNPPSSMLLCSSVGVLQPPRPSTSSPSVSNTPSQIILPMKKESSSSTSETNHGSVVIPSQGEVLSAASAAADTTTHDYLRSLLQSKNKRPSATANDAMPSSSGRRAMPSSLPIKEISIPSTFSPTHSYRAMAAYSLLRTLSKELRLSPFTFQAFANALMLPVPSKLLGEVHVRVLRVLFAAAAAEEARSVGDGKNDNVFGRYFYDKFGDGGSVNLIQRRKRTVARKCATTVKVATVAGVVDDNGEETKHSSADDVKNSNDDNCGDITDSQSSAVNVVMYGEEDEYVPKRGGNNLSFLDQATWPLFFQDYALAKEGMLMEAFDSGHVVEDDDEFIDMRSVAMLPSEDINLHPTTVPTFDDDGDGDSDGDGPTNFNNLTKLTEYASRCPAGPLGKRNHVGRFVCCPFHILAAVQMYRNMLSPASTVAISSGSTNVTPLTMTSSTNNVLKNRSKPRKPVKNERKARRKSSAKVRKWDDDDTVSDEHDTDDDDYTPPVKCDSSAARATRSNDKTKLPMIGGIGGFNGTHSPGVRGNRVSNIEVAASVQATACALPGVPDRRAPQGQAIMTPGQGPTAKAIAVSQSPLSNIQQSMSRRQSLVGDTTRSFRPIVLPEVQQFRSEEESILVVSRMVEKALDSLFMNRPSGSTEVATLASDHDAEKNILTKCLQQRPREACNDHILAHMVPVHHLEQGIPHHHLCLNDKLTILEFLLDELLQVTEIANEMTRRQDHTSQVSSLYGAIPSPRDYEEMENEDECKICGVEGQLLCCDGCPGSFHRICIGIAINAKLPEGKWLCPECKIIDSSRMAPLELDTRPLIKWFTLSELGLPAFHQTPETFFPHGTFHNLSNKPSCIIPTDVEFLVSSGLVFARYRTTHELFDPLHMSASRTESNLSLRHPPPPPLPLNYCQLGELLKLLGPKLCSYMPWLRIPFTPQKIFSSYLTLKDEGVTLNDGIAPQTFNPLVQYDDYLKFLIYYQDAKKELLANYPDWNNPMMYSNGYSRAPSIPLINNHQGLHLVASDSHNYPANASTLAVAILDMTVQRDHIACIPYVDPTKSIRNSIIQLEQTLRNACLIDFSWGTYSAACWRKMVHNTNSIMKLGSLLVDLIDTCSTIAFVSDWYKPKECLPPVNARADSSKITSIVTEEWSSKREITRRKWERSKGNDILRLHNGILSSSLTKRGKLKKTTEISIDAVCSIAESNESQGESERNSLTLSSSRCRSDRLSTVRQQIETLLGVTESELTSIEKEILEIKLARFEHIMAEEDAFSINWPIAGKTLFEADGTLSRPIVRKLARNAGSVRAPSITYDTAYDVGETALCHRWRKITNKCTTFEGLLFCLRFVNAHMNKATIITATTAANQTKSPVKDVIRCVHTDPCSGFKEYFVVPMNKNSGRWYSEQSVDIISLIHYHCEQRKSFVRRDQIREPKNYEREATTVDANNLPTKKSQVEVRDKQVDTRLQAVIDKHRGGVVRLMHESAARGEKAVSKDLLEEHRSETLIVMRHANLLIYQEGGELFEEFELKNLLTEAEKEGRKQVFSVKRRTINEKKREFQAVVNRHRVEILKLMKEISARGESIADSSLIKNTRSKNMIEFRSANLLVKQVGGNLLTEYELKSRMSQAEEEAGRLFESEGKEDIQKEKEREFRSAIDMHRDVIVCLLKESGTRGESHVDSGLLDNARAQNLFAIKAANQMVHEAGGKLLQEIELKFHLTKAEEAASRIYRSSTKRAAPSNSAMTEPPDKRNKEMSAAIKEKEREFEAAVDRHKEDTLRLMRECAKNGGTDVSTEDMTAARNMNFIALVNANRSILQAGGKLFVDAELQNRISRAEKEAVAMYIRDMHLNKMGS